MITNFFFEFVSTTYETINHGPFTVLSSDLSAYSLKQLYKIGLICTEKKTKKKYDL